MLALPEEEAKAGLLRCLEYFGATRLDAHAMRIPFGLGASARTEEIDLRRVSLDTLGEAARACVSQAAALAAEAPPLEAGRARGGEAFLR